MQSSAPHPAMRYNSSVLPFASYTGAGNAAAPIASDAARSGTPQTSRPGAPAMVTMAPGTATPTPAAPPQGVIIRGVSSPSGLRSQTPLRSAQQMVQPPGGGLIKVASNTTLPQLSSLPLQGLSSTGGNAIGAPTSPHNGSAYPSAADMASGRSTKMSASTPTESISQPSDVASRLARLEMEVSQLSQQYKTLASTVVEMPRKLNEIVALSINELGIHELRAKDKKDHEEDVNAAQIIQARVRANSARKEAEENKQRDSLREADLAYERARFARSESNRDIDTVNASAPVQVNQRVRLSLHAAEETEQMRDFSSTIDAAAATIEQARKAQSDARGLSDEYRTERLGEAAELVNKRLADLEKRLAEDWPIVLEQCAIARSMTENTKTRVSVLEAAQVDIELQAVSNRIEDVANELSKEIQTMREQLIPHTQYSAGGDIAVVQTKACDIAKDATDLRLTS